MMVQIIHIGPRIKNLGLKRSAQYKFQKTESHVLTVTTNWIKIKYINSTKKG